MRKITDAIGRSNCFARSLPVHFYVGSRSSITAIWDVAASYMGQASKNACSSQTFYLVRFQVSNLPLLDFLFRERSLSYGSQILPRKNPRLVAISREAKCNRAKALRDPSDLESVEPSSMTSCLTCLRLSAC